ncbi:hypothetical protein [Actinomadura madurae]|uniref:hypothetical protein n=1 Tax=Actinomadura madurae TaxID=1993 RepID=UPI0020D23D9D|nr:hypothetical protein [Actinomadura madurae]MCP9965086.1 hypothetical protein [Actinomadura madurae]MCQ0013764.1 hypothetical protein [Actinomadura madurae]
MSIIWVQVRTGGVSPVSTTIWLRLRAASVSAVTVLVMPGPCVTLAKATSPVMRK